MDIAELFSKDQFQRIIDMTLDNEEARLDLENVSYIIGSLCFLGRKREAELLMEHYRASLNQEQLVLARFHLAVAYCRHYEGEKAVFEIRNLRLLVKALKANRPQVEFFLSQAIAFYRFTYGQAHKAEAHAQKSYKISFLLNFPYGKILALDLNAHINMSLGNIRQGLWQFEELIRYSERLDYRGAKDWASISLLIYKSQFGILGAEALSILREKSSEIGDIDHYSQALLELEIARQELWAGLASNAAKTLSLVQQKIFQFSNPRMEIRYLLMESLVDRVSGNPEHALSLLSRCERLLKDNLDHLLETRVSGMKLSILSNPEHEKCLATLHQKFPVYPQFRNAKRIQGVDSPIAPGQDPYGDAIDLLTKHDHTALSAIIDKGWLGLLPRYLDLRSGERAIAFDVYKFGSISLVEGGNVFFQIRGLSPLIRRLFEVLAKGPKTKEELIFEIWKVHSYHPERHDSLVHNLLTSCRKLLAERSDWLNFRNGKYHLEARLIETSSGDIDLMHRKNHNSHLNELNPRQRQLTIKLESESNFRINLKDYKDWFAISDASALRDLRLLCEKKILEKKGNARSTYYVRHEVEIL